MRPVPWGLLQAGQEDTTLLAVVIVLILVGVGFLVARAAIDKLTGAFRDRASYQLIRRDGGELVLAKGAAPFDGEPVSIGRDGMEALVAAVEDRNEMRLHGILDAEGGEHPFEDWRRQQAPPAPAALLVEDSRGDVLISVAGTVEARPPLDEAVQRDLLEVLEQVLEAPRA